MSGRAEKVFRFIGPLAAIGLAALLSIGGCEQGNPDPPREPGIRASPVEIDLVADLPDAWLGYGNVAQLLDEDMEQPLSQGWYPVEQQADGTRSAWSMGRRSVIEITVLQPEDRLLEIDLEPAPGEEHLPHQSVRLFWNDQELGRFPLDWSRQTLQIELPAEIQRSGINRLTFSPLYWISPLASRSALDPRPVAFRLYGVRFSDTPVGSSESGRAVAAEGTRIEQPANSMISWHYTLPSDPKLQLNLSWDLPSASKGFLFRWVLRDTRGQEHVLLERTPAGQDEESLTLDLSPYAGEMVALVSLFSSADEGPAGAHVTLDAPRIVGTRPSPASPPAPRRPYNVLVVLFDTLRPDYLEPHGSSPARTPSLTKFASTGFTFEQAHANASLPNRQRRELKLTCMGRTRG